MNDKQLTVVHSPSSNSLAESINDYNLINKYNHCLEDLIIEFKDVDAFIKKLKNEFNNAVQYTYKINRGIVNKIIDDKFTVLISLSRRVFYVDVYTKDEETLYKIYKIYKNFETVNKTEIKINMSQYSLTPQGITNKQVEYKHKHFQDINEKFYPYIDIDLFMDEFIYGSENILILCGAPGTGKSKFASLVMKKLIENPDYAKYFSEAETETIESDEFNLREILNEILDDDTTIYAASAKNTQLVAMDDFWNHVKIKDLLILDDLDFLLTSRDESRDDTTKNQFISNLLSFTDGIQKSKTKIIITTNQPFDTIDEALLRRGRLFAILEFRPLTYEEGLEVWKSENLDEKLYDQLFKEKSVDGYIKHSELGEAIENVKRNKKYVSKKTFILDDSIDALHKAQKQRAGLI